MGGIGIAISKDMFEERARCTQKFSFEVSKTFVLHPPFFHQSTAILHNVPFWYFYVPEMFVRQCPRTSSYLSDFPLVFFCSCADYLGSTFIMFPL